MDDSTTYVIGMDLSDRKADFHAARHADGEFWRRGSVALTPAALAEFFGDLPRSWVVIEIGTHSRWVKEALEEMGHQVTVCNARRLRFIFCGRDKTDQLDAKALCDVALLRPALLHPVKLRDEAMQRDLAIVRSRDAAVRARTLLVNNVRGTVKTLGERIPGCSPDLFAARTRVAVSTALHGIVEPTLQAIEALSRTIAELDARIEALSETDYPETAVLKQVFGVGPITALAFVLTLFDPDRFPRNRDVGPYLGLTPSLLQSGLWKRATGISKEGNAYLRRLLTQCAHTILRRSAPDSDLRRHGLAIWQRGGKEDKGARRRAVTAVARKLAVLLCALCKTAEVYEPLRNSPAA
jgi:transposase